MNKVSITIASYNNSKFLPEVLESIFNQTYNDFEIIVVDDASTDNTQEVAKQFNGKIIYERLPENRGSPVAWNKAISLARGEYIVLAAADDVWLPERLAEQVKILDSQKHIGLVYGKCITTDENGIPLREPSNRKYPSGKVFLDLFLNDNFMPASTVIFRKDLLVKSGMLDEALRLCQDYDFYMRLSRYTEVAFINKPIVKYRKHPGSVTTGKRHNAFAFQRKAIYKIWTMFKDDKESGLTYEIYRKRLVKQCLKEGRYYLRYKEKLLARESLREALKTSPFNPAVLFQYLRTLL
jgi:glycosyltransferase involved in cell wall biosynthesis